jgi:adhesin transport system membrane fusion protein
MGAAIKLTAFDFAIYGNLQGRVVHVSADTVVDETRRDLPTYYEVFIELSQTSLEGPEGTVEIRPGMIAVVELDAGSRTVLQYLLKLLFRSSEALRER